MKSFTKCDAEQNYYWCIFNQKGEIYLENGALPMGQEKQLPWKVQTLQIVGYYLNTPVVCACLLEEQSGDFASIRNVLHFKPDLFAMIGYARQLYHFLSAHQFCANCGHENEVHSQERALICPNCQTVHYPTISPCVIMAVTKKDKILLANHTKHGGSLATVLAGFVEIGENLEQAVAREVYEETQIKVKNIRYFGSQPWAFPSQLMVGFKCEYASGDIEVDKNELNRASWVRYDEIPDAVPPHGTIARALIDDFVVVCSEKSGHKKS